MRRLITVIALAVLSSGCSGSPPPIEESTETAGPLAVIRTAIQATEDAKTGQLVQQVQVATADSSIGLVTIQGPYDLATPRSDLKVSVTGEGTAAPALVPPSRVIRDGDTFYYTVPGNPQFQGKWLRRDAKGIEAEFAKSGAPIAPIGPGPVAAFSLLQKLTEPVAALGTYQGFAGYRVIASPQDVAGFLGSHVLRLMADAGVKPGDLTGDVPVEILITPDGRIQRARFALTPLMKQVAERTDQLKLKVLVESGSFQVDLQLAHVGAPVTLSVPKAQDLLDSTPVTSSP